MSVSDQEARARLGACSLRATAPRIAVLKLLAQTKRPLSHTEVVDALSNTTWDQATLFRNLVKLTNAGLIRVASELSGIKRYEFVDSNANALTHQTHPHFVCNACGVVSCLPESTISAGSGVSALGAAWSGALSEATIHILGVCPPCQSPS